MYKGKFIFYFGRTQTLLGEKADASDSVSEFTQFTQRKLTKYRVLE